MEAYVYGSAGLELVASDTLIDGPLFNDAPHVHEVSVRPFVPVGEIGLSVRPVRNLAFGFGLVMRGAEVEGVDGGGLGSVAGRLELGVVF